MRVVSTAYIALVDKNRLTDMINPNACFFDVVLLEEKDQVVNIVLDNGTETLHLAIKKYYENRQRSLSF